ncbi:MAG: hypothetical protein KKI14_02885, partial [Nanoarchaeota archaeon]|nr:hypothetical protein [Nanoarchaeota archaeon]
ETANPLFKDVTLIHQTLSELCINDVDTTITFFGKKLSIPLMITAMTGGAEKSREILNGYNSFDKNEIDEIYQAIYDHSGPVDWKSKVSEGLFLSDKIFEHMGAYVAFRAPLWICETGDRYPGLTRIERFLSYYERAKSKKLLENYYPEYTQKLVDYQLKWNNDFVSSLTKREEWSDDIIKNMFDVIKNGDNPERAIRSFKPKNNMQELWLKETLDYIDGKKYEEFEKMIP